MKASDIPDAEFLEIVRRFNDGEIEMDYESQPPVVQQGEFEGRWAFVWDVARIGGWPEKVTEAKAAKLIKRGLMTGCDARHWCRGDYELTEAGRAQLEELVG